MTASERGPVILIIEDHGDSREMYAMILNHEGFAVVEAHDAAEGLALASEHLPSVVVTDLMMPGPVSAVALCEYFSERNVPVIVVTGVAGGPPQDEVRRAGCAELIVKPLDPDALVHAVRRLAHATKNET